MTVGFDDRPLLAGTRLAARIEYHGAAFSGWQAQPNLSVDTVQETLEAALGRLAVAPVRVHAAGRTDTGVHGFAQVIHFDDPVGRSPKAWVMGTNSALPQAVRVHWVQPVSSDFHARFSAEFRRYRYLIANTPVRPAQLSGLVTWYRRPLDAVRMDASAQALLGEQDFSAFRAASCQSQSPRRRVTRIAVERRGDLLAIDIVANAFLHHMVRNIAGALMLVGAGVREPGWVAELLAGRDRTVAADTAPGDGLYLIAVDYPEHFALPPTPDGPLFWSGLG